MASIFQCYHSPHLSLPLLHAAHKTERQISSSMLMVPKQLLIKSLYRLCSVQGFFFNSQGLHANTSQAAFKQYAVLTLDANKFDIIIQVQI